MSKFIFAQLPTLSIWLLIVNVPVALLQLDPLGNTKGKYVLPDPYEYILDEAVFG